MKPCRGEIWLVRFDPQVGVEIQKTRPAVVLTAPFIEKEEIRTVVPIASERPHHKNTVYFHPIEPQTTNSLSKKSSIDCLQIKSFSLQRFVHKIGKLTQKQLDDITYLTQLCIGADA